MTPSWDLFIMLFFIAITAYGFLLQRDKAVVTMISIYVALVITAIATDPIQAFFSGEKAFMNQIFIRGNTNTFTIQVILFLSTIGIVSTKSGIEGKNSESSVIETFGLSFLNSALIVSTILLYMDPAKREGIMQTSRLANALVNYHFWWIVLPIMLLVFTGFSKKSN
jgi:hypothetical protein